MRRLVESRIVDLIDTDRQRSDFADLSEKLFPEEFMNTSIILTALVISTCAITVHAQNLCPDGSYVGGAGCSMAPDGSYVGGEPKLAPDGTYVGGDPDLAPDGTYVGGDPELAPDGTYVGGNPRLAPDGSYVGVDSEED